MLIITGSNNRHRFFVSKICEVHTIISVIVVDRGNEIPDAPLNLTEQQKHLWDRHFNSRIDSEEKILGSCDFPDGPEYLKVGFDNLNSDRVLRFISRVKHNICLVFGSGIINDNLIQVLPINTFNLHLGLSPRYRGSATLFWPFYFLEPQFCGFTIHYLINEPDAGDIIHQEKALLVRNMTLQDVSVMVLKQGVLAYIKLLDHIHSKKPIIRFSQKNTGKIFLDRDFLPDMLRLIYDIYDDNIVNRYLDNEFNNQQNQPILKEQF